MLCDTSGYVDGGRDAIDGQRAYGDSFQVSFYLALGWGRRLESCEQASSSESFEPPNADSYTEKNIREAHAGCFCFWLCLTPLDTLKTPNPKAKSLVARFLENFGLLRASFCLSVVGVSEHEGYLLLRSLFYGSYYSGVPY